MQSNQYDYIEDLKYGDNQDHFIIISLKKWEVKIFISG